MTDRLREQIARIDHDLSHIHTVREELISREDRLLRQRQLLYNQLDGERESAGDGDSS